MAVIVAADHALAAYRAADLCGEFHPGMNERQVGAVMRLLPQRAGVARVRGDPDYMLTTTVREGARRDVFMQFAVVFNGVFSATRQCVVSVKAGRVESAWVTDIAFIATTPVQMVRHRP